MGNERRHGEGSYFLGLDQWGNLLYQGNECPLWDSLFPLTAEAAGGFLRTANRALFELKQERHLVITSYYIANLHRTIILF